MDDDYGDLPEVLGEAARASGNMLVNASPRWIENLIIGHPFDGDNIPHAMTGAAVRYKDPNLACSHRTWRGTRIGGASIADTIKSFETTFPQFKRVSVWSSSEMKNGEHDVIWTVCDDGAAMVSLGKTSNCFDTWISVGCTDLIQALAKWGDEHITEQPEPGTVYMMVMQKGSVKFNKVGTGGKNLERGNYDPKVLEAYDRIKAEVAADEPKGRLSIISGPAGTGKTHLIRALLQEVNEVIFIVVPQSALTQLVEPVGLTAMTELRDSHQHEQKNRPLVLLMEDADDALAPRKEGDTNVISALLNMGDGIVGSVLDVRILATTNREEQEFDDAIMRPGRLSTSVEVGDLGPEQANTIYERLTGKKAVVGYRPDDPSHQPHETQPLFRKRVTLAEIYSKAYDNGWRSGSGKKKGKMGFGS